MAFKIACDDGHGMETGGKRTPPLPYDLMFNGKLRKKGEIIHENEFNQVVMKLFMEGCKRCKINTIEVAPTDKDIPLATRVNTANNSNADLYISFHVNALYDRWQTGAYGLVVIHHVNCSAKAKTLANNVYKELKNNVKWYSNGATKYGVRADINISGYNLYVLKNTKMPAILVELGFMDNIEDVKIIVTPKFANDCAESILKGACDTLGATYISPPSNSPSTTTETPKNGVYRVVCGSYASKINATKRQEELKKLGVDSFLLYNE